jgi:hypothetical protein
MGALPGVFNQLVMPLMSGAVPQLSSCWPPSEQFDSRAFWSLTRPPRLSFWSCLAADLLLQAAGVVGDGALQHRGQVEDECHRQQDRHHSCDDPDLTLTVAERGHSLGDPATR